MEKPRKIIGGIAIGLAIVLSLGAVGLTGKALGWYDKKPKGPAATLEALNFEETAYGTYAVSLKDYEAREVVIPSEYEGKAVTEIGGASEMKARAVANNFNFLFGGVEDLKNELIGMCGAMQGSGMPSLPGESGFGGAVNVEKVTIPSSVKVINDCAFFGCISLREIEIPDSVIKIGFNAFRYAVSLTELKLPEGLEHCGSYAFADCVSLQSVYIPALETLPIGMFSNTALERIEFPKGVTFLSRYAFKGCKKLTEIVLPAGLEIIEGEAFENCAALKTVYNLSELTLTKGSDGFGKVAKYAENIYTELPIG